MKQTPISCVIVSVEVDMRPIDNNTVNRLLSDIVGNPDSFTRLFNEMNVPMYMVAFRILRNRADAEDAVQDVFLKLLKNVPTEISNGRAYIFQTVRNTAISRLRRRNFETSTNPEELLPLLRNDEAEDGGSDSVAEQFEELMEELDDEEREIFTLHVDAELGFREIAKMTGLSTASVFRRYRSAIRKLRSSFLTERRSGV